MHGRDIKDEAPKFEDVFGVSALVSFGDGGNEFGMGSAPGWFFERYNVTAPVSTAECLAPATTSNYGAYAVVKELEILSGRRLLPEPAEHANLIRRLVESGCVDGVTGKPEFSVDGCALEETTRLLEALRSM